MRVRIWRRVGPRRRLLLEAVPGLILAVSTISMVSVKAMQHSWTSATSGPIEYTSAEQQLSEQAKKQAESAKNKSVAKKAGTAGVGIGGDPLSLVLGSDPAPASQTVFTNRQMWFISTPTSDMTAHELARDAVAKLRQVATNGAESLVIMEPTVLGGGIVNLGTYQSGGYDTYIATFFNELKSQGINDQQMGMWTLLPEGNMPEWGNSDPLTISNCIIRTAKIQKTVFPDSLITLMLNAKTYPGNDTAYANGQYKSLLPYVQSIPKGLVDSLGYQGFPWLAPANQPWPSDTDPANYLRANLAIEAARSLGVHSIWFNTGTQKRAYINSPVQTATLSAGQRGQMLNGVLGQVKVARAAGFGVAVNIFAGDKSASSEAIDWSYPAGADKQILDSFVGDLRSNGMSYWQYTGN